MIFKSPLAHEANRTVRYGSITELAVALKVDRSYVRRMLTLATLASDIVESIVPGAEPSGLSLERLTKGTPMMWEEQRGRFRFIQPERIEPVMGVASGL